MGSTRTGCDIIARDGYPGLRGMRTGLLENPSSFSSELVRTRDVLSSAGCSIARLFGPQHGILGQTQANMIEWEGYKDPASGIQVHSLYGRTRAPLPEWIEDLDAVVIDLQDVGARPYTYIWTSLLMMKECAAAGVGVVVLDRPNPAGGELVEGPVLGAGFESFVGMHPLPLRHGMTIGEVLSMIEGESGTGCRLEVVKMEGWKRSMLYEDTGLPWLQPSPNIPTPLTALVYSGMVLLEGTVISEGRGTTTPFETAGAPWIEAEELCRHLSSRDLPGTAFRPVHFVPAFDKYEGETCGGVHIHVTDYRSFRPVRVAVEVISAAAALYPDDFDWIDPPYEYEEDSMPIDIIYGGERLREAVGWGEDPISLVKEWRAGEENFAGRRAKYLLYGE